MLGMLCVHIIDVISYVTTKKKNLETDRDNYNPNIFFLNIYI